MKKGLKYFHTDDIPRMEFVIGTTRFSIQHIRRNIMENVIEHQHPEGCYEIHMISKGQGRFVINGNDEIFEPGSILFIGPGIEHKKIISTSGNAIDEWINLYAEKIGYDEISERDNTVGLDELIMNTSFWRGRETPLERSMIDMAIKELLEKQPGYQLIVESAVKSLIVSVSRNFRSERQIHGEYKENALKYPVIMDDYFMLEYSNLNLQDLADKLNLSVRQTERLVCEYYNKSFTEKKLESRMKAAIFLKEENPDESIEWIARKLGYPSPNYFSAVFKSYYGKSPTKYYNEYIRNRNC